MVRLRHDARPRAVPPPRRGGQRAGAVPRPPRRSRSPRIAGTLLAALLVAGCASPAARMDRMAAQFGFVAVEIEGEGYRMAGYRNGSELPRGSLHLYLEGDGNPWATRSQIARDPTARNPLAVAAMTAAVRREIEDRAVREVVVIGYSGGGVLAWFLAQRIPEVEALVTIAANLDIDRWTDIHRFSRLEGSLNPAAGPPMRAGVEQWHLVGRQDRKVPPWILGPLAVKLGAKARVRLAASDHDCCWLDLWPDLLRELPP